MTYEEEYDGKKVVVMHEYAVYVHECPECGIVFCVTAMFSQDEDDCGKDSWSGMSQIPKFCYMCGASM